MTSTTDTPSSTGAPRPPLPSALEPLGRHWGWIALRGAVAVLLGLLAFVLPGLTLAALVIVWGAYALVDGALALVAGWRIRDAGRPLWPLVLAGVLGVLAGLVALIWPGLAALSLVVLIACWSVAAGLFQLIAAVRFRKEIRGEWLLALSGVLAVVFGVLVLMQPAAGALVLTWLFGSYTLASGVLLIALALRLRRLERGG